MSDFSTWFFKPQIHLFNRKIFAEGLAAFAILPLGGLVFARVFQSDPVLRVITRIAIDNQTIASLTAILSMAALIAIERQLRAGGIEISFPQSDVHIREAVAVTRTTKENAMK